MVERSAVAARTGILSSRDINDASRMTAAIIPTAQTIQGRREKTPVLFTVDAIMQFVLNNLSLATAVAVKSDYLFRCRSLPKNRKSLLSLDDEPLAGYNGICRIGSAIRWNTPKRVWMPSFPRSRPGPISFPATTSYWTDR